MIGHRGAAAVAPGNSLEGLAAAVHAGADLVEFDLDAELRLGHPGERRLGPPPSLEQALAFLAPHAIGVQIDLKRAGVETRAAAAVRAARLEGRVAVSSNSAGSLARLAREAPELTRIIGYPRDRLGVAGAPWPDVASRTGATALRALMPLRVPLLLERGEPAALALHHALVSAAAVTAVHARGCALIAWTVNTAPGVERLARLGVDAIVSDDPQMALEALATLSGL